MESNQPHLKFFAIARMSDRSVLASECSQKGQEASLVAEAKTILSKIEDIYLKANERQKIRTTNGSWFCTVDEKHISYLVLTDSAYPERHAYTLVNELRDELQGLNNYHGESAENVQNFSRKKLFPLLSKYDNLENLDQIIATRNKVNEIKNVMGDSINRLYENRETLDIMDKKSGDLNRLASGFYDSSRDLHNKVRAQRRRMIIYGIVGLVLLTISYFLFR